MPKYKVKYSGLGEGSFGTATGMPIMEKIETKKLPKIHKWGEVKWDYKKPKEEWGKKLLELCFELRDRTYGSHYRILVKFIRQLLLKEKQKAIEEYARDVIPHMTKKWRRYLEEEKRLRGVRHELDEKTGEIKKIQLG